MTRSKPSGETAMVTIASKPWLMKSSMAPSWAATSVPVETTLNSLIFSLIAGLLGEGLRRLDHLDAPGVADEAVDHGDAIGPSFFVPLEELGLAVQGVKHFGSAPGPETTFGPAKASVLDKSTQRLQQPQGSTFWSWSCPPRTMVRSCCGPGDTSLTGWLASITARACPFDKGSRRIPLNNQRAWRDDVRKRGAAMGAPDGRAGCVERGRSRAPIGRCLPERTPRLVANPSFSAFRGIGRDVVPRSAIRCAPCMRTAAGRRASLARHACAIAARLPVLGGTATAMRDVPVSICAAGR